MGNPSHEQPGTKSADATHARRTFSFHPIPPQFFVDELRFFLRDNAPENVLLDLRLESKDADLQRAWGLALMDWVETPPRIRSVTFANHPAPYHLMLKAAAIAIKTVAIWLMRNEMDYQDGEQSFKINHQYRSMLGWAADYLQDYNAGKARIKAELNVKQVFGGSSSEFGASFRQLGGLGDVGTGNSGA